MTLLLPGALGMAAGLLLAGGGMIGAARLYERRLLAQREQIFASLGEVKVRLATNSIRLDNLSQRVEQMPMREQDAVPARAAINELTAEVGLLGDLIHQVATTLADHDAQLAAAQSRQQASQSSQAPASAPLIALVDPEAERRARADALAEEHAEAQRLADQHLADERAAIISLALSEGKVEVHLQPIVQLPQRRTRGYEALVRLRLDETTLLLPDDFLGIIEARGFGPTLDALVLTRALAIARHLGAKEGGLFVSCNFSAATWGSSKALATLSRILDKYREHAGHLVVEMPQRVFRILDPTSLGLLGAMSVNGVRFALDQVSDLKLDPVALFDRGVRFVKVPAALLQAEMMGEASLDIAAGDLAAMMERASIVLVADEIADNPTVADMLELGVTYAQGLVFSPARPVKPEVFAEPEPEAALPSPPAPAPLQPPMAEIVGYPAPSPAAEPAPERVPFRAVLRRANA